MVSKSEAIHEFIKFSKTVQNEKALVTVTIRSDHGGKFVNEKFELFCESNGYEHNFSSPRTVTK